MIAGSGLLFDLAFALQQCVFACGDLGFELAAILLPGLAATEKCIALLSDLGLLGGLLGGMAFDLGSKLVDLLLAVGEFAGGKVLLVLEFLPLLFDLTALFSKLLTIFREFAFEVGMKLLALREFVPLFS